ncbi:MAG TPA: hypothetical protein VN181_10380 [Thermoanaerobaculia bacterium]|nr:hypothetical protein [Thermoanaerobaculia bacterium]
MVELRRILLTLTLCAAAAQAAFADVDDAVARELTRLDALYTRLAATTIAAPFNEVVPGYQPLLERLKNTRAADLRLYRMRDAFTGLEAMAFYVEHETATMEDVQKLWNERRGRFESNAAPSSGALLQLALAQAARNRAQVLFKASLPYGKADGPKSGIYYMGEAEGQLAYAKFVESLPFPRSETAKRPTAAALAAAIDALDTESIALFEKAPTERTAIPSSALLKEARELVARGWVEAATFTMLEARFDLTRRQTTKNESAKAAGASARDTIEGLWLSASRESERGDAIVAGVLPFYQTLLTAKPAARTAAASVRPLTITLIRWPYT